MGAPDRTGNIDLILNHKNVHTVTITSHDLPELTDFSFLIRTLYNGRYFLANGVQEGILRNSCTNGFDTCFGGSLATIASMYYLVNESSVVEIYESLAALEKMQGLMYIKVVTKIMIPENLASRIDLSIKGTHDIYKWNMGVELGYTSKSKHKRNISYQSNRLHGLYGQSLKEELKTMYTEMLVMDLHK